jgi:TetR/AcrR family transcriptional regulator, transcriptional repressor for nem operon
VRITNEQAKQNRERVVETASELFRERGFDGVSVADLMEAAGFTHGGFYNHFKSKDELSAKALKRAFEHMRRERERARDLEEFASKYLSGLHRRVRAKGCPAAALAGDASRQSKRVKSAFAEGVEGMIGTMERLLPGTVGKRARRRRAINLVSRMVGALALARAVPEDHRLGGEILRSAKVARKD